MYRISNCELRIAETHTRHFEFRIANCENLDKHIRISEDQTHIFRIANFEFRKAKTKKVDQDIRVSGKDISNCDLLRRLITVIQN
jgi:hypothetical protein